MDSKRKLQLQLYLLRLLKEKHRQLYDEVKQVGKTSIEADGLKAEIQTINEEIQSLKREL